MIVYSAFEIITKQVFIVCIDNAKSRQQVSDRFHAKKKCDLHESGQCLKCIRNAHFVLKSVIKKLTSFISQLKEIIYKMLSLISF